MCRLSLPIASKLMSSPNLRLFTLVPWTFTPLSWSKHWKDGKRVYVHKLTLESVQAIVLNVWSSMQLKLFFWLHHCLLRLNSSCIKLDIRRQDTFIEVDHWPLSLLLSMLYPCHAGPLRMTSTRSCTLSSFGYPVHGCTCRFLFWQFQHMTTWHQSRVLNGFKSHYYCRKVWVVSSVVCCS